MPLINSKELRLLESKGRSTRKPKWKPEVKANFIEKLNDHSIENINLTLEVSATNIDVNQKMIDDVVTDVCSSLKLAASDAGVAEENQAGHANNHNSHGLINHVKKIGKYIRKVNKNIEKTKPMNI